jgi:hypothetical protein
MSPFPPATTSPKGQRSELDIPPVDDRELTIATMLSSVLRHRRRILLASVTAAALAASILALTDATYSTNASFVPGGGSDASSLSTIAAQFGVSVGGTTSGSLPSKFYADLLSSPWFLQRLAKGPYVVRSERDSIYGTLMKIYDVSGDTPEEQLDEAVRLLSEKVLEINASTETGQVTATISSRSPELSQQIGRALLREIDAFSTDMRRKHASAETGFMVTQVDSARRELRSAEDLMQAFVERNRAYSEDPVLTVQHDRLQRDLLMRQQVYTSLVTLFEQARIEAGRSTPTISVVEPADLPLTSDRKHLPLYAGIALIAAGLVASALFIWIDFRRQAPDVFDSENAELAAAWSETKRDLNKLVRPWRQSATV